MSATDEKRFEELLIYGECEGPLPACAHPKFARETRYVDGRTYWVGPEKLIGKSLVESVREQMANWPKPPA
jgi:hypothetical protein